MIHRDLAAGRWYAKSLAEQLGNVGSEYERARQWRLQADGRFEKALDRFLELLDLTINNPQLKINRKRELLRAREYACSEFTGGIGSTDNLSKYFYQFAFLARRGK